MKRPDLVQTLRDNLANRERVMASAAMMKVSFDRGDDAFEAFRFALADFVKSSLEEHARNVEQWNARN